MRKNHATHPTWSRPTFDGTPLAIATIVPIYLNDYNSLARYVLCRCNASATGPRHTACRCKAMASLCQDSLHLTPRNHVEYRCSSGARLSTPDTMRHDVTVTRCNAPRWPGLCVQ